MKKEKTLKISKEEMVEAIQYYLQEKVFKNKEDAIVFSVNQDQYDPKGFTIELKKIDNEETNKASDGV